MILAVPFSSKSNRLEFSFQSGPRSVNRENKSFWPRGRLCWKVRQPQRDQNYTPLSPGPKEKRERGTHTSQITGSQGRAPGHWKRRILIYRMFYSLQNNSQRAPDVSTWEPCGEVSTAHFTTGTLSLREKAFLRSEATPGHSDFSTGYVTWSKSLFISRSQCYCVSRKEVDLENKQDITLISLSTHKCCELGIEDKMCILLPSQ